MRILFGPEHDGLHISPNDPGAYEWWYFDATSEDDRYILVVIFFLGTPMSPYYKAVVDGKSPLPKDWCGVFVSLHERTTNGYKERAYAYNLYRDKHNSFRDNPLRITLGDSQLENHTESSSWSITLNEPGLWLGTTTAELTFTSFLRLEEPHCGIEDGHTWVCVAPLCRVQGTITLADQTTIAFHGNGYHDHNFGQLPWSTVQSWIWSHIDLHSHGSPDATGKLISYILRSQDGTTDAFSLLIDPQGIQASTDHSMGEERTYSYQLAAPTSFSLKDGLITWRFLPKSFLNSGPFYVRGCTEVDTSSGQYSGKGIGEIFEPARLCGPIISRAMWTRIRRRS